MNNQIVKGSMTDMAQRKGLDLATSWTNARALVLCDVSGSMDYTLRSGRRKYDVLREHLVDLQGTYEGQVAVFSFSNFTYWHPDGNLPSPDGNTEIGRAIQYILPADKLEKVEFWIISDGEPTDGDKAIELAKGMKHKFNTIFIGEENEPGARWLRRLAEATGGTFQTDPNLKLITEKISAHLLGTGK